MCTIAAVKIAQKTAAVPDAEYRRLLRGMFGASSCRDLTGDQRDQLRKRLIACDKPTPMRSTEGKVWALWYKLRAQLPPERRTAAYLYGICARANKHKHSVTSLADLDDREIYKAIEALKVMLDNLDPVPF